jgi:hypothetical protein
MSGPVVVIGFLLLIPSVLGMLFGILTLVGVTLAGAGSQMPSMDRETRTRLEAQQVPEPVITQVADSKPINEAQLAALTPQQQTAVRDAQLSVSAGNRRAAGGGSWRHLSIRHHHIVRRWTLWLASYHAEACLAVHTLWSRYPCFLATSRRQ